MREFQIKRNSYPLMKNEEEKKRKEEKVDELGCQRT